MERAIVPAHLRPRVRRARRRPLECHRHLAFPIISGQFFPRLHTAEGHLFLSVLLIHCLVDDRGGRQRAIDGPLPSRRRVPGVPRASLRPIIEAMRWTTKLVGRAAELAELDHEQRRAAAGEFRSVLLLADAGIGKTRLAREFLLRKRRRALVLAASGRPWGETASFALWSEAIEGHLRTLSGTEITELCGGFVDELAVALHSVAAIGDPSPDHTPSRLRVLEGLAALLSNLARRSPVIALLDDAHLADPSSIEGLSFLARNLSDERVLVIAAARRAELGDNPTATDAFLRLEQEGLLRRLELGTLDAPALSELAESLLEEAPPEALVDWLAERSRGNALFAIGLLYALLDEGAELTAPALRSLPEGLTDRVSAMVKALDEESQIALETLAAVGRRARLRDLASLTGFPLDHAGTIAGRLVRLRLAIEDERGPELVYEIAHPLIQEAIYQCMGAPRRRTLHRSIGRMLREAGRLGEAAPHFARAAEVGDDEAIELLRDAVREAEEHGAYREALTILDALVEILPAGDDRWVGVLEALSWHADWVVDHRADEHALLGVRAMRAIDSVIEGSSEPASRAQVKLRLANFLGWGAGELGEAEHAAAEARSLFEHAGDRASALLAENELAWIRGLKGDLRGMEAAARRVASKARGAGAGPVELQALTAAAMAASSCGRFGEAEEAFLEAVVLAKEQGNTYRHARGLMALACSRATEGRVDEARSSVDEAKKASSAWRETSLPEWESIVHWFAGDFPAAVASAEAAEAWTTGGLSKRRALGVVFAALAAVETGETARARRYLAKAKDALEGRPWRFFTHACDHAEALLAWQKGGQAEALRGLRDAARRILATGALPFSAVVFVDLAELAAERGDPETVIEAAAELEKLAQEIDRDLYHGLAAIGRGWAGEADAARKAVDLLATSGCEAFHARALDVVGASLVATDRVAAAEALELAARTFQACGAVWRRERTYQRLRGLGARGRKAIAATLGPTSLSRRERQVARLAVEGLTAREIADRLFISQRTVESHLASVYAKLGVHSKLDLTRRAAEFALNQ